MKLKKKLFDVLYASPVYPNIYFFGSPFKVIEWQAMMDEAKLNRTDRVLDIGSGHGLQTGIMARHAASVVGIDISANAVNRAKSEQSLLDPSGRVDFRCTSIENAGFESGEFDKVMSVCVLEHIPDYRSVLREAYRVLKPGGRLVFSVDSLATIRDQGLLSMHRERYAVCRYFTAEQLNDDFNSAAFVNVRIRPLARSRLAAAWFGDAIRRDFRLRYFESWWKCQVLKLIELFTSRNKDGIYLLVTAEKPA